MSLIYYTYVTIRASVILFKKHFTYLYTYVYSVYPPPLHSPPLPPSVICLMCTSQNNALLLLLLLLLPYSTPYVRESIYREVRKRHFAFYDILHTAYCPQRKKCSAPLASGRRRQHCMFRVDLQYTYCTFIISIVHNERPIIRYYIQ